MALEPKHHISGRAWKYIQDNFKDKTVMLTTKDMEVATSLFNVGLFMTIKQAKYLASLFHKGTPDTYLQDGDHPEYGYDPYSVQEIE